MVVANIVAAQFKAKFAISLARLLSLEPSDDPDTGPDVIVLEPEADALCHAFQLRTEAELGLGDLAQHPAWGGKLCGLSLRIELTLHVLATWGRAGTPSASCPSTPDSRSCWRNSSTHRPRRRCGCRRSRRRRASGGVWTGFSPEP
jgi:hypothetical protein